MNPYTMTALVILAIVATASYFWGTKKNRWLAARLTKDFEEILHPSVSNYVNIGGSIGYNFTYSLPPPYTSAKGTITLSPRHSLLYLPISLLIGVRDRYFVNVFVKKKILGEGHLVAASYLKKANIEGIDSMERRAMRINELEFVALWRGIDLSKELEDLLSALPDPARLRHFCAYPDTKTFFVHGTPGKDGLKANLEAVMQRVPAFVVKEKE